MTAARDDVSVFHLDLTPVNEQYGCKRAPNYLKNSSIAFHDNKVNEARHTRVRQMENMVHRITGEEVTDTNQKTLSLQPRMKECPQRPRLF